MPASAAMARMVVRSKPSAAKRRRAAARIAALVSSDRREKPMPTSVGQRLLTSRDTFGTLKSTSVGKQPLTKEPDMSELPSSTDVLIVGAGPVGLTLATALQARGVDVVLVD